MGSSTIFAHGEEGFRSANLAVLDFLIDQFGRQRKVFQRRCWLWMIECDVVEKFGAPVVIKITC